MKPVITGLAFFAFAQPAFAQSVQEQIITQLQAQGYSEFLVERTWLGRIRIETSNGELDRELVFNPHTGEILRDRWEVIRDNEDAADDEEWEEDFEGEDDDEFEEDDEEDEDNDDEDEEDDEEEDDDEDDDD